MGYVLPNGQMSLWGVTVITHLLHPIPSLIEWLCGGHYVYNPTLKKFFVFHFLLLCGFLLYHIFHLHCLSSNNPPLSCQPGLIVCAEPHGNPGVDIVGLQDVVLLEPASAN